MNEPIPTSKRTTFLFISLIFAVAAVMVFIFAGCGDVCFGLTANCVEVSGTNRYICTADPPDTRATFRLNGRAVTDQDGIIEASTGDSVEACIDACCSAPVGLQ